MSSRPDDEVTTPAPEGTPDAKPEPDSTRDATPDAKPEPDSTRDMTPDAEPEPDSTRDERAYVIAMCAIIGAAFAYAACEWGQWPRLLYLPMREELTFDRSPAISIFYLGLVLWGIGGLVVGALVGALLCKIFPRPWPAHRLRLFGAWAITAIVLAGCYFTWALWPWASGT